MPNDKIRLLKRPIRAALKLLLQRSSIHIINKKERTISDLDIQALRMMAISLLQLKRRCDRQPQSKRLKQELTHDDCDHDRAWDTEDLGQEQTFPDSFQVSDGLPVVYIYRYIIYLQPRHQPCEPRSFRAP